MNVQYLFDATGNRQSVVLSADAWDALLQRHPDIAAQLDDVGDLPQWQKDLLDEELRKLDSGELQTRPWEEVKADFERRFTR